jgi:Recombinase
LSFARGHIYKILSNPLYIGEIEHRGVRYPGQHPPLIDRQKWDAVQAQLAANHHENRTRINAKSKSLLTGLIYDDAGNRLVSSHATKNGKRYRYYITSQGAQRSAATPDPSKLRLPATMIDELLRTRWQSFLTDKAAISILLRETRCRPAEVGRGPWNPQRIEQRIGRCHRYGQKHDVVVVNFLNQKNEADQRVYQLLSEKFQLFDGVFGASDAVLGVIESGVDFEKRIAGIYQQCRQTGEIKAAFDQLQHELTLEINQAITHARQKLFENFDDEVREKLKVRNADTNLHLNRFEQQLMRLAS